MSETDNTVLEMKGVCKSFGTSIALQDVHFQLKAGEIHGLLGGNGAGKTTLMNILFGLYRGDACEICLRGEWVDVDSPHAAIGHKIGMVHQQFLQIKSFSVLQNIVLGTPVQHKLTLDLEAEEKKLGQLAQRFGLEVDLHALIEELPMGVRQKVEILKALYRGIEVLILDEPTTNLTPQEVDSLFQSLRVMVKEGLSIIFITHKLKEVLSVCDRITVLRNGRNVLTLSREQSSEEAFVRAMVGDEMNIEKSILFSGRDQKGAAEMGEKVTLDINKATLRTSEGVNVLNDVTLQVHEGEILGVAGVANNGQHELAEAILAVQPLSSGAIRVHGLERRATTQELLEGGVAYIPEDSLVDGFLPKGSVAQNLILGYHRQAPYSRNGFMNGNIVDKVTRQLIREFNIKTLGPGEVGANLSGGNIQRVMIARAFSRQAKLLVAHNPTRGLDLPSTDFVYSKLLEGKQDRVATLLISENLDELLLMCDRIAVIYRGAIVGTLRREQFEKYEIGRLMSGVENTT
jgi:ABC-type uncharacterized transport system ATPase subunit